MVAEHALHLRQCPREADGGLPDHRGGHLGGIAGALGADPHPVQVRIERRVAERAHLLAEAAPGAARQGRDRGRGRRGVVTCQCGRRGGGHQAVQQLEIACRVERLRQGRAGGGDLGVQQGGHPQAVRNVVGRQAAGQRAQALAPHL